MIVCDGSSATGVRGMIDNSFVIAAAGRARAVVVVGAASCIALSKCDC